MKNIKVEEEKEIAPLQKRSKALVDEARVFKVSSIKGVESANEFLKKIKVAKNYVAERKNSVLSPLNEARKNLISLFKPIEEQINSAEYSVKRSLLEYKMKADKQSEERKSEIVKKVESGKVNYKEASRKIEAQEKKMDKFNVRKQRDIEIVDEKKIPREYLSPNVKKIKEDAFNGKDIPGVRVFVKEVVVVR